MVSELLLDRAKPTQSIRTARNVKSDSGKSVTAYHACLVGNYMSYLRAAGYSKCQSDMHKLEMGAKRFLTKFPDPNLWLGVSLEEQRLGDCKQRSFLHYLFFRRILPMPLTYLLMPRPHLYKMAMRLMERIVELEHLVQDMAVELARLRGPIPEGAVTDVEEETQ